MVAKPEVYVVDNILIILLLSQWSLTEDHRIGHPKSYL